MKLIIFIPLAKKVHRYKKPGQNASRQPPSIDRRIAHKNSSTKESYQIRKQENKITFLVWPVSNNKNRPAAILPRTCMVSGEKKPQATLRFL
ncbi:hypothetical protein IGS61_26550 [Janthinobacterium sp. FW305-129]|nr:hypothetical protein [Janthinobacterium sp. FW305-129]